MRRSIACLTVVCSALLPSCGTPQFSNAPPATVEDCRREVAILTDRDALPPQDDPLSGPAAESIPDPIEDARTAKEVAGGAGLATWPEEALLYRCLASRGIELTAEQAAMLTEWEGKLDSDSSDPPRPPE
ncbi:MAG: hypothetical protein WD795_17935 [Woeseia sp.]